MNEMTRITISKIIAGIVVMLIALNYIGNNGITYTSTIAITDQTTVLHKYYENIQIQSDSVEYMVHDMNQIISLSNSIIQNTPSCYFFSILNKTKYILSNYTALEYIVLQDNYIQSVIENKRVRTTTDLTVVTIPAKSILYPNSTFEYSANDIRTYYSKDDDTVIFTSESFNQANLDNVADPIVFLIKLNLYEDTISTCAGSVQVSLFMIGLILFW